jgi:hypothetical protein
MYGFRVAFLNKLLSELPRSVEWAAAIASAAVLEVPSAACFGDSEAPLFLCPFSGEGCLRCWELQAVVQMAVAAEVGVMAWRELVASRPTTSGVYAPSGRKKMNSG